ncbi:MAG: tetratricopeptide repeat protein [Cytophagales bacterium]|nr:MAG: tetratricopeptide repeat protein [Cytophagales bacterium]
MKSFCFILILVFAFFSFSAKAQQPSSLDLGLYAFENEEWTNAAKAFSDWLRAHPNDSQAFWFKAQAEEYGGNLEAALTDYSSLLTLEPENAEAYFARGRVRYQLKQYNEALDDFEDFLLNPAGETNRILFKIAPGDQGVSEVTTAQSFTPDLAYFHMGLCAIELKNYELALSYLDLAIEENPRKADYFAEQGRAFSRLGENMAAIDAYQKALDLDPDHKIARQGLAATQNGGDAILIEELNELIANGSANYQTYKQRGFFRMNHQDMEGALSDFSESIKMNVEDPESYFYRAWTYKNLKRFDKAEEDYSAAITLEPQNPGYFLARGQARYQNGKAEEALADFTLASSLDPEDPNLHYHKGIALHRLGKTKEACQEWKIAADGDLAPALDAIKKACQ